MIMESQDPDWNIVNTEESEETSTGFDEVRKDLTWRTHQKYQFYHYHKPIEDYLKYGYQLE